MTIHNPSLNPIMSATRPLMQAGATSTGEPSVVDYIIPVVAAIVLSNLATGVIDELVFSKKREEEITEKMYHSIEDKIRASSLPIRSEDVPKDVQEVEGLIDESLGYFEKAKKSLENARSISSCGVCKTTLERVKGGIEKEANQIESETKFLKSANKKVATIRKLKREGKIPENKKWEEFTKDEKELVRRSSIVY